METESILVRLNIGLYFWTSFIFATSILIKLKSQMLETKQGSCKSNLRFDLHLVQLMVYLKNWESTSAWGALHNSFMLNLPSISIQLRALLQLQYVASVDVNTHLLILPGTAVLCSGYSVVFFFFPLLFATFSFILCFWNDKWCGDCTYIGSNRLYI